MERAHDKPSVYLGSNPRYDNTRTLKNLSLGTRFLISHRWEMGVQNTGPKSLHEKKGYNGQIDVGNGNNEFLRL